MGLIDGGHQANISSFLVGDKEIGNNSIDCKKRCTVAAELSLLLV